MKKIFFTFLLLPLVIACSSKDIAKINWQGELISKTDDINYLYWKDGNQFITQEKDSIIISMAGFEFEDAIYILISLSNNKTYPVTFFTKQNKISYNYESERIYLQPIRPKNLDKTHFSFFNTVIGGAGRISRMFLNIPMDILLGSDKAETNTQDKIGGEYHDESTNITKKLFIDNHTLFPGTNYAGFLVFECDPKKNINMNTFDVELKVGTEFKVTGSFIK